MTAFICGNSHVGALRRGYRELFPGRGPDVTIFPLGNGSHERAPFSELRPDGVRFTAAKYADSLKQHAGRDAIGGAADIWGVCLGTQNVRIYNNKFWIDADPAAISRPGIQPVSGAVLDAIIVRDQCNVRAFFAQLRDAGARVFAVSGAPPRSDHPCIRHGVRPQTVSFIDRAARLSFAGYLSDLGIDFVTPPPECLTDDGFLKAEFNHVPKKGGHDKHHANTEYGARMVNRVLAYLETAKTLRTAS